MTNIVTMLNGHWPQWYGTLGMQFIYIYIRHGNCQIGVGGSHKAAENNARVVRESPDLVGVFDIEDAINELRVAGYHVKSIIVPEHVEEVDYAPITKET